MRLLLELDPPVDEVERGEFEQALALFMIATRIATLQMRDPKFVATYETIEAAAADVLFVLERYLPTKEENYG